MAIRIPGGKFEIVLNWKIALFYIFFMPVLLRFGFWQIERAEEKKQLEQDYNQRMLAQPISLQQAFALKDRAYVRVALTGTFDNQRLVLLDNKIFQGRVGYEVITPFVLASPLTISVGEQALQTIDFLWVNRGWISLGENRKQLPKIPQVESPQRIIVGIDIPAGEPFILADEPYQGVWPEVVQKVDVERMSERYREETSLHGAPFMVRLAQSSPGALQMIWQPINMIPAKHLGYALQWFTMALALTLLYLYVTIKRRKENDDQ
ncbi:MAG: SURF1 family protein [Pseudomonadales bacterium]|nr:SURF1 family protein [Pseudomonadales bacterium]